MALPNFKVIKDEQTTQERAPVREPFPAKVIERIPREPIPLRKGRHLDVDRVLERSLPRVASE